MRKLNFPTLIAHAVTFLFFTGCTHAPKLFSPRTDEVAPFVAHTADKPMQSYLAMNLAYGPYKILREQIEARDGLILKNRGEAHITVITPIEFDQILKRHLNIDQIHNMAAEADLQKTAYDPVCVGEATKELDGKPEKTYFVVVRSAGLIALRQKVQEAYQKAGGVATEFDPKNFYPHVTLGYTKRDLHFEDGVKKDLSTCTHPF